MIRCDCGKVITEVKQKILCLQTITFSESLCFAHSNKTTCGILVHSSVTNQSWEERNNAKKFKLARFDQKMLSQNKRRQKVKKGGVNTEQGQTEGEKSVVNTGQAQTESERSVVNTNQVQTEGERSVVDI